MAPLDETTGNAPNGKGSSDKASSGAAPGDDDDLDDFLESIM